MLFHFISFIFWVSIFGVVKAFIFLVLFCNSVLFQSDKTLQLLSCNVHGLMRYDKRRKIVSKFLFHPDVNQRPHIFSFQEMNVITASQPAITAELFLMCIIQVQT